jgi:hypothetical protein
LILLFLLLLLTFGALLKFWEVIIN